METTYNGWTNYATWRVNLEMFDGMTVDDLDFTVDGMDKVREGIELAMFLENYVDDFISESAHGLALGYAQAFLSDVNWGEIARHLLDAYCEQHPDTYVEDAA